MHHRRFRPVKEGVLPEFLTPRYPSFPFRFLKTRSGRSAFRFGTASVSSCCSRPEYRSRFCRKGLCCPGARAQSLKIEHAYFGLSSKVETFHVLLAKLGLTAAQAAFVGDEVSDLPLLREVAFAATVPDAVAQVRAAVHYVTQRPGGAGAVREVADMIRAAQA